MMMNMWLIVHMICVFKSSIYKHFGKNKNNEWIFLQNKNYVYLKSKDNLMILH